MAVDIVYTWVDHNDKGWQALKESCRVVDSELHASADSIARYSNRNEIYFSIKSVKKYFPSFGRIFIVTNCAPCDWMLKDEDITVVDHKDLFPNDEYLPTFNSHAIETVLHHIPSLSDRFLYFNDDFFLCQAMSEQDFFWGETGVYFFPSKHSVPYGKEKLRPVDHGAINSACLLEKSFHFFPGRKLSHSPYPLSKSVLFEIERRYPDEVESTRSHIFRHPQDIAMATTLHAYYAKCVGVGKESYIRSRYVDIGDWRFVALVFPFFSPLMRGKYKTLCLNEVEQLKLFPKLRDRIVKMVMEKMFEETA